LPLVPAEPEFLGDVTLHASTFDDVYIGCGALDDAPCLLTGNGLPELEGPDEFRAVENFLDSPLATWAAWRETAAPGARLHFISVESIRSGVRICRAYARWLRAAALASDLIEEYPPRSGFHRLNFADGRVKLTLLFGEALDGLRELEAGADAFYLDGFAPAKNPDMWSDSVLRELARLARPGATLATYSVAGAVRAGLAAAGFTVERRAGLGRKREMRAFHRSPRVRGRARAPRGDRDRRRAGRDVLCGTACDARVAHRSDRAPRNSGTRSLRERGRSADAGVLPRLESSHALDRAGLHQRRALADRTVPHRARARLGANRRAATGAGRGALRASAPDHRDLCASR
jgi:tRNA 5-methylaminomethyl-2-thiouridine biosynthesis bifunctional protein